MPQNIPPEALQLLDQEEISQLANSAGLNAALKKKEIEDKILSDDALENNSEKANLKSTNFGYDFFNRKSLPLSISNDIPFQADYKISFNDLLKLNLTGNKKAEYNLLVDLSGMVNIPEIGKVSLNNLTLSEAQDLIYGLIENAYLGTKPYLSISEASLKKISVVGAVENNGTFLVNPFISISEAISYAGGLVDGASLRKVQVIRSNGAIEEVDLYRFLAFGDRSVDLNLENGDTLLIQKTDYFVEIEGTVQDPKIFEFIPNESYEDIIAFAGGFKRNANTEKIAVLIQNNDTLTNESIYITDSINPRAIKLFVPSFYAPDKQELFVSGPLNGGFYNNLTGKSLLETLDKLPLTKDIYPFAFNHTFESDDGLVRREETLPFDDEILSSVYVSRKSKLKFYSYDDIFEGNVNQESKQSNLTVYFGERVVNFPMSGRFIPREILDYAGIPLDYDLQETFIVTKDGSIKYDGLLDSEVEFQPKMRLYFPEKRNNSISVALIGAANLPGNYNLEDSSTLLDLYNIAGGLREDADTEGITLKRISLANSQEKQFLDQRQMLLEKIIGSTGIENDKTAGFSESEIKFFLSTSKTFDGRLIGNLDPESQFTSNLNLEDGDVVLVPFKNNLVNVIGEVMSPSAIEFNFSYSSHRDYVNRVGGYTDNANKSQIFIVSASGKASKINMFSDIEIKPGDTIVVPRDFNKLDGLPLVSLSSRILSDLLLAAASLNAISN